MSYKVGDVCRVNNRYTGLDYDDWFGSIVEITKVELFRYSAPLVRARVIFSPVAAPETFILVLYTDEIDLIEKE